MVYEQLDFKIRQVNNVQSVIEAQEGYASEVMSSIDPNSIMVDLEAIHAAPYATRNYTRYMKECLQNSIPTWTKPYGAPLIKHHDEDNGDIIGRVVAAEYKSSNTLSGTPALMLTVNIPDEEAKRDVKNGLLQTVSIGILSDDVRCSICGHKFTSQEDMKNHEHIPGEYYGSEMCTRDFYQMNAKEVSFVVVPSDMFAKSIKVYNATTKKTMTTATESLHQKGDNNSMTQQEFDSEIKKSEEKVASLESQLKIITESKESLDNKVKDLETAAAESAKKLEALEKEKAENATKIEGLEAKQSELTTKISDLEAQLQSANEQKAEEVKMKEGLESELQSTKIAMKESMISELQALRQLTGRSLLDEEKVKNRSEASIQDSISDLRLEVKESANSTLPTPGSVSNPTLSDGNEDTSKISNKEKSNVDLKAGLESIIMGMARVHS